MRSRTPCQVLIYRAVETPCWGFGPVPVMMKKFQKCARLGGCWLQPLGRAGNGTEDLSRHGGVLIISSFAWCSQQLGIAITDCCVILWETENRTKVSQLPKARRPLWIYHKYWSWVRRVVTWGLGVERDPEAHGGAGQRVKGLSRHQNF